LEKKTELKRFIFKTIGEVAEVELHKLELEIAKLKRDLRIKEALLSLKFKVVNDACEEYGFVLQKIPCEENGPYRLDIGE
jgi:hypothetical protein